MNSLQSAGILPFYKEIKKYYGEGVIFITGDNGDKIPYTIDRPLKKFSNLNDLTNYTIKDKSILPIESISKFLNLHKEEIIEDVFNMFKSFPETDLTQKYIHFRINEKPFKYAFQGEDRHRNYFWSISPFWSFPFQDYLMNCPDEIKIRHRTFRAWIESYSQGAAEIDYPYFKSPITSFRGRFSIWMAYYLYPLFSNEIKAKIKDALIPGNPVIETDSNITGCLEKQLKIEEIFSVVDTEKLTELMKSRRNALFNLLTVISAIEFYNRGNSTLSDFIDETF